jgi:hypothetical protein
MFEGWYAARWRMDVVRDPDVIGGRSTVGRTRIRAVRIATYLADGYSEGATHTDIRCSRRAPTGSSTLDPVTDSLRG